MKYIKKSLVGDMGEHFFIYKIMEMFRWPCRLYGIDLGIDAEIEILDNENRTTGRIIKVQIKRAIDNDWIISVPTSVVYRKRAQRIAEKIPLENLVLETDAPFLGPAPRKKGEKHTRNEPANIIHSLNYFAEKREISKLEIAKRTTKNAQNFYQFK